ncbi:MAG: hypothetical protein QM594_13835 [Niabella sp.]
MKKLLFVIFPILIISLVVISCGKKPWEHYTPPELIPLPPEPPREKAPARNETFRVKIIALGINKNGNGAINNTWNQKEQENADTILKYEPDIVLIREADKNNTRSGLDKDQAKIIADLTYMKHYYIPILPSYNQGQYGIAILSRNEITNSSFIALTGSGRAAGMGTTTVNGFPITFAGAQIDDTQNGGANRTTQSGEIFDMLKDTDGPIVLALGLFTFNTDTEPGLNTLRQQFTSGCSPCAFNIPAATPTNTGDHIMFKPMNTEIGEVRIIEYKVLENGASNRRAVYAEVEFKQ